MGLQAKENDSPKTLQLIEMGKEITRLVREAVTADRHSRKCSLSAHPNRWTESAKNRDYKVRHLREKMRQFSEEL